MRKPNKLVVQLAVALLMLMFVAPAAHGRSRRFAGHREYLRYTRNLPNIDRIELLKLRLIEDKWNGDIVASRVWQGGEAQKLASLWRRQTYTSSLAACHNPAYAIKFYSHGKLLGYASVCWSCNSIFMIAPAMARTQSFRGGDKKGEQLSEIFRLAFTEAR
jgi:hypothetical protein